MTFSVIPGKRHNVLARNASWPDNPRSAAHRAAQDLVNEMPKIGQISMKKWPFYCHEWHVMGPTEVFYSQGLDWIAGPGYSFGVFSKSRFLPPALSLVDNSKTLRYQQGDPTDLL